MNINRKVVAVEVEGRKMGLVLDFESAIAYEEATGESIFKGIAKIDQGIDIKTYFYLISATLRNEKDELVGQDYVKKMNLLASIDMFIEKIDELMNNSVPEAKEEDLKKKETMMEN